MQFLNDVVDEVPNVSVVTKIELLGFNAPEKHGKLLKDFINDAIILDLTESVVDKCIHIRKLLKTKLPDAIIASTALVYGLTLITHNTSDFNGIEGLLLIDPHSMHAIGY